MPVSSVDDIFPDSDFHKYKNLLLDESAWTKHKKEGDLESFTMKVDFSPLLAVKVVTEIEGLTFGDIVNFFKDYDYASAYNNSTIFNNVIAKLDENTVVKHFAGKLPSPITNRDSVIIDRFKVEGDEFYYFKKSISHKDFPPTKNFVRAFTKYYGYYIVKVDEMKHKIYHLCHIDPRGSIPTMLVNMVNVKTPIKQIKDVFNAMANYNKFIKEQTKSVEERYSDHLSKFPQLKIEDIDVAV